MNSDIRIQTTFPHHPKTKKLKRKLGADGVLSLIYLWIFIAQNRPNGDLSGLNEEDIAIASDWEGDTKQYIDALISIGFLDRKGNLLVIHDWEENNPWAAGAEARSEKARKAAKARWDKPETESEECSEQCGEDAASMQQAKFSNAPILSSPPPSPNPQIPKPEGSSTVVDITTVGEEVA